MRSHTWSPKYCKQGRSCRSGSRLSVCLSVKVLPSRAQQGPADTVLYHLVILFAGLPDASRCRTYEKSPGGETCLQPRPGVRHASACVPASCAMHGSWLAPVVVARSRHFISSPSSLSSHGGNQNHTHTDTRVITPSDSPVSHRRASNIRAQLPAGRTTMAVEPRDRPCQQL